MKNMASNATDQKLLNGSGSITDLALARHDISDYLGK